MTSNDRPAQFTVLPAQEVSLRQFCQVVRTWNYGVRSGQLPFMATDKALPVVLTAWRWHRRAAKGQVACAAIIANRCVGMSHVKVEVGRRSTNGIVAVSVDSASRGLGIGSALLHHLATQAWAAGFSRLTAEPVVCTIAAIATLRSAGFTEEAVCPSAFKLDDGTLHPKMIFGLVNHSSAERISPVHRAGTISNTLERVSAQAGMDQF